jgi:SET domain-containing protein
MSSGNTRIWNEPSKAFAANAFADLWSKMVRKSYVPGDFDLRVGRSKSGLGLYAESEIPKGACVIEYVGPEVPKDQEDNINSLYLFEVHARKTIDGSPRWNTARYINHSCRPNCEPNIHKGRVFIHALRKIKPGEELNYDYGVNYFKEYLKGVCRCPKCSPEKPAKATAKKTVARKMAAKKTTKAKAKSKKRAA